MITLTNSILTTEFTTNLVEALDKGSITNYYVTNIAYFKFSYGPHWYQQAVPIWHVFVATAATAFVIWLAIYLRNQVFDKEYYK